MNDMSVWYKHTFFCVYIHLPCIPSSLMLSSLHSHCLTLMIHIAVHTSPYSIIHLLPPHVIMYMYHVLSTSPVSASHQSTSMLPLFKCMSSSTSMCDDTFRFTLYLVLLWISFLVSLSLTHLFMVLLPYTYMDMIILVFPVIHASNYEYISWSLPPEPLLWVFTPLYMTYSLPPSNTQVSPWPVFI